MKSLTVEIGPDNLEVDPKTGDIWTGGCWNAWKMLLYNPENPPGSEVCYLKHSLFYNFFKLL